MIYKFLVERAIREQGALLIRYRNNSGNISSRVVEPTNWIYDHFLFQAYCHLRNTNRRFKTKNIVNAEYFSSAEEAISILRGDDGGDGQVVVESNPRLPVQQKNHPKLESQELKGKDSLSNTIHPSLLQVTDAQEWQRLLNYYKECLEREYVEQFSLNRDQICPLPVSPDEATRLLLGEISLNLERKNPFRNAQLFDLLQQYQDQSIYISTLFLGLDTNAFVPLFLAPLDISKLESGERYSLQADEYEVNYAALKLMNATEEEVAFFLNQLASQPNDINALEAFVVSFLEEWLDQPLEHIERELRPGFLCETAGIFRITGNNITGSLIQELSMLAQLNEWGNLSESLRYLLTYVPEHDYPVVPDEHEDPNIYIAPMNDEQRRAANAARNEPLIVITGPPGTGKSQVVLNLIANAFLDGKSVLFASKNNQAVDVVIERLAEEYKFPCIRTGNKKIEQGRPPR